MWLSSPGVAVAIPQFSLMTGNKCLNCHVNTQGSGLRNELGWYVARDMNVFNPKDVGLGWLYALDQESNTFADGKLTVGMDMRGQMTRSPRLANAQTRVIPMQFALHAAYKPTEWLTIEGMAEFASLVQQLRAGTPIYPGQQSWSASLIIQPSYTLPSLRVGHFQPSIGIRYDDHTMLVRQVAGAFGAPLIAPNYAEYGAEINYDGLQWLTLTVGAFLPRSLAATRTINRFGDFVPLLDNVSPEAELVTLLRSPSTLVRAMFWPRTSDHTVNSYAGASFYNNGNFSLANIFAGIGLTDRLSLMGEYALSGVRDGRQTRNWSAELMYHLLNGLLPYVRYEEGRTTISAPNAPNGVAEQFSTQIIGGVQFFPVPYLEIRPEFRYFDTEVYRATRWNLQVHLFY
jgi:hypothetical protein